MSILLIFENKNARTWAKMLAEKLTNTTIEIYPNVKNADAVKFVICWKPPKNILQQFPNVKFIQSAGASIDHILNTQTINNDVYVTRIVDKKLSHDMWEFLLTTVLMQLKNAGDYQKQINAKVWQQHTYRTINETTVAIMGLGEIGAYVAKNFAQLGFNVKGWSNSEKKILNVTSFSGKENLGTCLKDADFLINLLPLTKSTENILNKDTLLKLPHHSFFINVGRGEHLVDTDLIELLDSSKLSGALLDVFRTEPLPHEHQFWKHSKIQITPHVASLTNIENATNQFVENYYRFLNKQKPEHCISINKGY